MNCNYCCEWQDQIQQQVPYQDSSAFCRSRLQRSRSYRDVNYCQKMQQNRISLKRKNSRRTNNFSVFQLPNKPENVKLANQRIFVQKNSENNLLKKPMSYQSSTLFRTLPTQYSSNIKYAYNAQVQPTQIYQPMSPIIKTSYLIPTKAAENIKRIDRPQINITYNPIKQMQINRVQQPPLYQISPIKVNFESCPSPTSAEKKSNIIEKQNQKQSSKQDQLIDGPQSAKHNSEFYLNKKNSSIEFNRNPENNFKNRGKMSQIQFKKLKSFEDGPYSEQKPNKSLGLIKSMKLTGHLDDVQCKRTESVADASDQRSQISQVIMDLKDYNSINNKMTSSDIKLQHNLEKIQVQPKRSIIWQSSRKQSYSEF